MVIPQKNKWSKRGLVRLVVMKIHIMLQALSKLTGSDYQPKDI